MTMINLLLHWSTLMFIVVNVTAEFWFLLVCVVLLCLFDFLPYSFTVNKRCIYNNKTTGRLHACWTTSNNIILLITSVLAANLTTYTTWSLFSLHVELRYTLLYMTTWISFSRVLVMAYDQPNKRRYLYVNPENTNIHSCQTCQNLVTKHAQIIPTKTSY